MSVKSLIKPIPMFETPIEELVPSNHKYRNINKMIDFDKLCAGMEDEYYSRYGRAGYHPQNVIKMLLLQWMKDLSDRQLAEELSGNNYAKWFCGFDLLEPTPEFSFFHKFRKRIGTKGLANIFNKIREGLKSGGYMHEVYSFVDSSKIEAQVNIWNARDKAIEDKENNEKTDDGKPTMNNKNCDKYSRDKDARYGAKGKNNIWFGFKRHASVDCSHGFINKVAVTAANIHDGAGVKHVCPKTGAVLGDKAYAGGKAQTEFKRRGLHSMAIKPNNSKTKDRDKDKFLTKLRMPFEGVFAHQKKRARYLGKAKVQFQAFMEAMVFNINKAVKLEIEKIPIT